jgi:S-DNA-T family DNA segregation ATPase FtsK/SpoIIIE
MAQKKTATKSTSNPSEASITERIIKIWLRVERFAWDAAGIFLIALSLMTLVALVVPSLAQGALLMGWTNFLRRWFGWGSLMIVAVLGVIGLMLLRRRMGDLPEVSWGRVFALEGAAFTLLPLLTLLGGYSLERAEAGLDGGQIGWGLATVFDFFLPQSLSILLLAVLFALFMILGLGLGPALSKIAVRILGGEQPISVDDLVDPAISVAPAERAESPSTPERASRKKKPRLAPEYRKHFRVDQKDERPKDPLVRDEHLPPLKLLIDERDTRPDERHINQRAGLIEQTLAEFGVPAKVIGFQIGPTVTQFAVEPGFIEKPGASEEEIARLRKVRVSQITSLGRDLALALSAERLRVQAPVPGRPYVGIEVPNQKSAIVRLRPVLETESFYKVGSPLALALGRNVSGEPVIADLAAMPHLLIAGTTGSGKSVCIAAFTSCLVMNNSPQDLRLVMIDPKMVELVRFNGLPHLYGKVETDLERILGVLRWVVTEMDQRYIALEQSRSRNIDTYNRKMRRRKDGKTLPRIVVMVDELADLMMSAPEVTEHSLVRLAQMARAVGIHLVVATQRPSTDVVTGLIKANFPARMSFAVASSVDSRVILDTAGAENLLGRGDMLFLAPEAGSPVRVQGVWVTDQEVEKVISFWQKTYEQVETEAPPWDEMLEQEAILADRDELVEKAIELVKDTQRASASMLQRQLRVGYPRASRLMDELEEMGIVGPSQGGGREREVLVDPDDEEGDDYDVYHDFDDY